MNALPSVTMAADPREATHALLAHVQQQWERQRAEADAGRRQAIVSALAAGLSTAEIGRAMGISAARVQQIRDDTR